MSGIGFSLLSALQLSPPHKVVTCPGSGCQSLGSFAAHGRKDYEYMLGKPGKLQAMGLQRVGQDLATKQQQITLLGEKLKSLRAQTLSRTPAPCRVMLEPSPAIFLD